MAGYSGFGTVLSIQSADVAELTSISGPAVSMETIDVSSHDSLDDEDGYRTFVASLIDGGEVSMEGNLTTPAAGNVIMDAMELRTERDIVVTFPAAAASVNTWSFKGIVTAFETDAPHDDKLSFSASIKVTGKPVLA